MLIIANFHDAVFAVRVIELGVAAIVEVIRRARHDLTLVLRQLHFVKLSVVRGPFTLYLVIIGSVHFTHRSYLACSDAVSLLFFRAVIR